MGFPQDSSKNNHIPHKNTGEKKNESTRVEQLTGSREHSFLTHYGAMMVNTEERYRHVCMWLITH